MWGKVWQETSTVKMYEWGAWQSNAAHRPLLIWTVLETFIFRINERGREEDVKTCDVCFHRTPPPPLEQWKQWTHKQSPEAAKGSEEIRLSSNPLLRSVSERSGHTFVARVIALPKASPRLSGLSLPRCAWKKTNGSLNPATLGMLMPIFYQTTSRWTDPSTGESTNCGSAKRAAPEPTTTVTGDATVKRTLLIIREEGKGRGASATNPLCDVQGAH